MIMGNFTNLEPEVAAYGCSIPNCQTLSWNVAVDTKINYEETESYAANSSLIQFAFQRTLPVSVTRHSLRYKICNFVSDFGAYLSLMLGASILSSYDHIAYFVQNIKSTTTTVKKF